MGEHIDHVIQSHINHITLLHRYFIYIYIYNIYIYIYIYIYISCLKETSKQVPLERFPVYNKPKFRFVDRIWGGIQTSFRPLTFLFSAAWLRPWPTWRGWWWLMVVDGGWWWLMVVDDGWWLMAGVVVSKNLSFNSKVFRRDDDFIWPFWSIETANQMATINGWKYSWGECFTGKTWFQSSIKEIPVASLFSVNIHKLFLRYSLWDLTIYEDTIWTNMVI